MSKLAEIATSGIDNFDYFITDCILGQSKFEVLIMITNKNVTFKEFKKDDTAFINAVVLFKVNYGYLLVTSW